VSSTWEDRVATFWADADDNEPDRMLAAIAELVAERDDDDPVALYERASVHDFLGREREAIPLYRASLRRGLSGARHTQATIQLASSLRNIGDIGGAISILERVDPDQLAGDAAQAFLALALHDAGRHADALRTVLAPLLPTLSMYRESLAAYADELGQEPIERIRVIAVGLLVRDARALVEIYPASEKHPAFARALGGGVDFGETAADAVVREFREELGVTVTAVRLLGITENIFDAGYKRGHEIVHVFAIESPELTALSADAEIPVLDSTTTARWVALEDFQDGGLPFFPSGMIDVIRELSAGA